VLKKKKTPEEKAAAEAQREVVAAQREREKKARERDARRNAFFATPAGQARAAYERGDMLFQCSFNVMSQKAIIVAMVGSRVAQQTADPTVILNSVCHEGWDIVTGSFVFVETGQQSRDKFASSGQNVATSGETIGYYLFRRCEEHRLLPVPEPWESEEEPLAVLTPQEPPMIRLNPATGQWERKPDEPTGGTVVEAESHEFQAAESD
jgi:hypothetical protein